MWWNDSEHCAPMLFSNKKALIFLWMASPGLIFTNYLHVRLHFMNYCNFKYLRCSFLKLGKLPDVVVAAVMIMESHRANRHAVKGFVLQVEHVVVRRCRRITVRTNAWRLEKYRHKKRYQWCRWCDGDDDDNAANNKIQYIIKPLKLNGERVSMQSGIQPSSRCDINNNSYSEGNQRQGKESREQHIDCYNVNLCDLLPHKSLPNW